MPERLHGFVVMAVLAAGAFGLSVGWFRGMGQGPSWNAAGPWFTAASCAALLMSTPRTKWWLAVAAMYLQLVRVRGDVSIPLGLTFGLDVAWCSVLYAAFQGQRRLAAGSVVACAALMTVAALLRQ